MSNQIRVVVPAVPVAQPRPRATTRGRHARVYNQSTIKTSDGSRKPHPIVAFKASVRLAFQSVYSGPPLSGPVRCDVTFFMPRTKSQVWKRKPMPRIPHTKKPDRDNLDKAVMDALTGLAWLDDCQVFAGEIHKWIASGDEQPRVEILIQQVD